MAQIVESQIVESQITLVPGNLIVGTNLAAEYIRVTDTLDAGDTSVILTLKPVARFSEIPAVWGLPQATGNTITSWYISSQSETEIKITVTVGSGTGGDTVTMAAVLIGPQA